MITNEGSLGESMMTNEDLLGEDETFMDGFAEVDDANVLQDISDGGVIRVLVTSGGHGIG